jgi:hypothetical protein
MPSRMIPRTSARPAGADPAWAGRRAANRSMRTSAPKQGRPGEKAKCDPSVPGRGFEGLLNELVREQR